MGPTLRDSSDHHHGQWDTIYVCFVFPADKGVGDQMHHHNSLPSPIQRHGGTPPSTTQGGPHRTWGGYTPRMVLAPPNGSISHPDDSEARPRSISSRPCLWRATRGPGRNTSSQSGRGRATLSSTRIHSCSCSSRSRPPSTGADICTSPSAHPHPTGAVQLHPHLRKTWGRSIHTVVTICWPVPRCQSR